MYFTEVCKVITYLKHSTVYMHFGLARDAALYCMVGNEKFLEFIVVGSR